MGNKPHNIIFSIGIKDYVQKVIYISYDDKSALFVIGFPVNKSNLKYYFDITDKDIENSNISISISDCMDENDTVFIAQVVSNLVKELRGNNNE